MKLPEPPRHLSGARKRVWRSLLEAFELRADELELLERALDALDRAEDARRMVRSRPR